MSDVYDAQELPALIRQHTAQLLGVVRAFATDDTEAEDLLQDVWMIAAYKRHVRPHTMPIGAWLHVIALNCGRAHQRRARRRRWLLGLWSADLPAMVTAAATPSVAQELRKAALWRAVAELPALQRQAVLLRVVEDRSTRETAECLGLAEGTVKASLHRALKKLRNRLGDDLGSAPYD